MCGEKLCGINAAFMIGRITPACAGKSRFHHACTSRHRDHPRVCGEKAFCFRLFLFVRGSPPRMRGKASPQKAAEPVKRITPAYAGKSSCCFCVVAGRWDHPRVCGEKLQQHGPGFGPWGSPPRMRGKVIRCAFLVGVVGDHPRVCGEKNVVPPELGPVLGSPPRMRGKGIEQRNCGVGVRITPAYAGKRYTMAKKKNQVPDHPRVCGEKTGKTRRVEWGQGSPPRMRGKVALIVLVQAAIRITPAYAGKRPQFSARCASR